MSRPERVGRELTAGPSAAEAVDGSVRRGSMFGLPAETTFLFVLLVTTMTLSCAVFLRPLLASSMDMHRLVPALIECLHQKEKFTPPAGPADMHTVIDTYKTGLGWYRERGRCMAPVGHPLLLWQIVGLGLVFGTGVLLYLAHPAWYVRRRRLRSLDPGEAADLLAELDRLRRLAGVGRVRFLLEPFNAAPSAFVFGLPRRRALAISTGLVVRYHTDPAAFRSIVLHELAHLRNRDIEPTYLALTLTAAFGLVLAAYSGQWLISSRVLDSFVLGPLLQALLLGVLALLLLAALVRSREFQADARVGQWEGERTALPRVLRDMPVPPRRALAVLRALHPTPVQRVRGLSGSMLPFGLGYWGGAAVGLTVTVTLMGLWGLSILWSPIILPVWMSPIPGALVAAVVVVGRWRYESAHPSGAPRRMWPFSLGLATGTTLGPCVSPESFITLDDPTDLLMWLPGWVLLVVVATVPVTSWTIEAVAGWYRLTAHRATSASRRHLPLALVTAIAVAAAGYTYLTQAVMVGRYMVSLDDNPTLDILRLQMGLNAPVTLGSLVVPTGLAPVLLSMGTALVLLIVVNAVWHRLRIRPPLRPSQPIRPERRRVLPAGARSAVRTGLIGAGLLLLFIPLTSIQAHQLPLAERWHNDFLGRFSFLQMGAVVVAVTLTALVAAWRSRRWPLSSGALATVMCLAAGIVAVIGQGLLGNCVDVFEGPVSNRACFAPPDSGYSWAVVQILVGWTGIAVTVLLPPCAAMRARTLRARAERNTRPSRTPPATHFRRPPWRRRAALTLTMIAGLPLATFTLVEKSRIDRTYLAGATLGDRGWVDGDGYRVRMVPGWYDTTGTDAGMEAGEAHGRMELRMQKSGLGQRATLFVLRTTRWPIDRTAPIVLDSGGHRTTVAGARALLLDPPAGTAQERARIIVIEHGKEQLRLELTDHPTNWQDTLRNLDSMLSTWKWTSPAGK